MTATTTVEFSPEKDLYKNAREKSSGRWIIAHILKGSNKFLFFFTFLTTILSAVLSSGVIVIIGIAISDVLAAGTLETLTHYAWIILLMGISAPVLVLLNNLIRETLAQRIERDTRKEFYVNLLGKSQSFHDLQRIGNLMALATNDIRMLNFLISPALSLIINAFTSLIVPIVFVAIFYPTQLIITPITFCILFIITLRDYIKKIGPITEKLQNYFGELDATLTETLSGIEVVKANALESREMKKYYMHAKDYRDAMLAEGLAMGKYLPMLLIAIAVTIGFAHSIFLYPVLMNIGQIIAYIGLLTQLRFPTNISIFAFASVRLAIAGAERLLKIMNAETTIDQNIVGISKKISGAVKFDNVSFTYPNTDIPVLQNISFEINAGQTVAIVGTTGSGKTTLTKLLSRLYDVSEGRILIDNTDVREYALQSLRSQISFIEQDIFLFSNSIFDNISFGRTSSLEEVIDVAQKAQAHEFVDKMPKKYDSLIGERGVQLSGGEKQRIAIARAFLTDPAILILDDSTSAIDSNTEDSIQRAMNEIRQNRTTFLITHRLSQIRWADLILVLRHGRIVAKGTHAELLETSEEYRKIFVKRFDVDVAQLKEVC